MPGLAGLRPVERGIERKLDAVVSIRLRRTDLFARMGGDEFGLLLPETGLTEAQRVRTELRGEFESVVRRERWGVGLSAGAVTFAAAPGSAEKAMQLADLLLLECKTREKGTTVSAVATSPIGLRSRACR